MSDELLQRCQKDRDRRSYERLVESHRPLVRSVCRRFLRDPDDLDDAVQETFLKLAGHIDGVNGSLGAWLTTTARTTSVDLIRRSIRDREGQRSLGHAGRQQVETLARHEAIRSRLHEGLALLDADSRDLLVARFVRKIPLGVIAVQRKLSVPTACRRVADAVRELARVLRELGVEAADDTEVAAQFGAEDGPNGCDGGGQSGLRFAPDWHAASLTPLGMSHSPTIIPGCARTIRVGIFMSYATAMHAIDIGTKWQVHSRAFFPGTGLQLVGVIEPGTDDRGIIEGSLRDYGVLGGLIEADDEVGLATLDVLLLGNNLSLAPSTARAINRAVRGGMGLLNEFWLGTSHGIFHNDHARELMLAESLVCSFHLPGACGSGLPAVVEREHPLLPGMSVGRQVFVWGCGPLYRVAAGAQVLVSKDYLVPPHQHQIPNLGPTRMPCYVIGELGRGRIAAVHTWPHQWFARHLSVSSDQYFTNLLRWLADSRLAAA
jgi:RNA polymerase sigma factor (sigma-70 family)